MPGSLEDYEVIGLLFQEPMATAKKLTKIDENANKINDSSKSIGWQVKCDRKEHCWPKRPNCDTGKRAWQ